MWSENTTESGGNKNQRKPNMKMFRDVSTRPTERPIGRFFAMVMWSKCDRKVPVRLLREYSFDRLGNIGLGHLFPESLDSLKPRPPIGGYLLSYCVVFCLSENGSKPIAQQA